jgi:hypothetical protein
MQQVTRSVPHAAEIFAPPCGESRIERYGRWIARALTISADARSRAELSTGLRDLATSEYDWGLIAQRLLALYEEATT